MHNDTDIHFETPKVPVIFVLGKYETINTFYPSFPAYAFPVQHLTERLTCLIIQISIQDITDVPQDRNLASVK